MRFYLSSYYRWNTDVFYLSGFHIKSGRAVLHWHPCARQEVDPASPDETFLKNTYTACPERIELPKDALGQLVWLHTPCLSCRYFGQYNGNLLLQGSLSPKLLSPEEESMYIQAQCRLRYLVIEEPSETFAAMEEARRLHATFEYNPALFVHCAYRTTEPLGLARRVPPGPLRERFAQAGHTLFKEYDSALEPIGFHAFLHAPDYMYNTLLPSEIHKFLQLLDPEQWIFGGSMSFDRTCILDPCDNKTAWYVSAKTMNTALFYELFMENRCDFFFAEDASFGAAGIPEQEPNLFITGTPEKVQAYCRLIGSDKPSIGID